MSISVNVNDKQVKKGCKVNDPEYVNLDQNVQIVKSLNSPL